MSRDVPAKPGAGTQATSTVGRRIANTYLERSARPLASLAFVLPLMVFYEIGTRLWAYDPASGTEQRIIAFSKLQAFFKMFGATGQFVPVIFVVGFLLAWHIAKNDSWKISGKTLLGMLFESIALALPLGVIAYVFAHYIPLAGSNGADGYWPVYYVLSIGAGIYEELVFRLILFTILSLILIDLLKINGFWSGLLIVVISSVAFSAYHYLGAEEFSWVTFGFRTVAGVYFAIVFIWRGFGVTVGTHASYDILINMLAVSH